MFVRRVVVPSTSVLAEPPVAVVDRDGYVKMGEDDVERRSIELLQSGRSAL